MTENTPESTPRVPWKPTDQQRFATKPTGGTQFMRIFFPYQLWRFLVINLKMLRIIRISHRH